MGKKSKGNRQTATNAPARQSPVASPSDSETSLQRSYPKPKPPTRDALFGEPLTFDSPKLIVRDYDARREPIERKPIPTRIHTSQVETVGRRERDVNAAANARRLGGVIGSFAGGFRFSPGFREYMIPVLPSQVAAFRSGWQVWWRNPYLVSRLRVKLGDVSVDALLAVRRDGADWNEVAKRIEKSLPWLVRRDGMALKAAHDYYRTPQAGPLTERAM